MVDGYSRLRRVRRASSIPLALPGILAVVVFAFTLTAHEFIYALAFISPSDAKTISIGVPDRADPRRRLLLAVADGRGDPRRRPDRLRLQPPARPLHRRLHHGRGEGLTVSFGGIGHRTRPAQGLTAAGRP